MENLFEGNNWDTTRETLLDGLEGNKRDVMSSVLENTKNALTESARRQNGPKQGHGKSFIASRQRKAYSYG